MRRGRNASGHTHRFAVRQLIATRRVSLDDHRQARDSWVIGAQSAGANQLVRSARGSQRAADPQLGD